MGTSQANGIILSQLEYDAIGEVMNISMGSAATALSQMLDKQVEITTPTVMVQPVGSIVYERLEPALMVKITYTEGISGSNVMVFKQTDMQIILNTLMGIGGELDDDFVFDELSVSAACEVMNQMMGSSATALAEFLGKTVDISPPDASVMSDENTFIGQIGLPEDTEVVTITFRLTIKEMLDSEFISVLPIELAKGIISQFVNDSGEFNQTAPPPTPASPEAPPMAAQPADPQAPQQMPYAQPPAASGYDLTSYPQQQGYYPPQQAPVYNGPPPYQGQPDQTAYYQQPQYAASMYQPPVNTVQPIQNAVNARPVAFPDFGAGGAGDGSPVMGSNLDLIMNVPLSVSIEIGTTKRKIRDIMGFTSGTIVELEKQAGSPVDVVVNGQLIAHGDVVVIDDNFGVRITEIVGTKDLLNSLSTQQ